MKRLQRGEQNSSTTLCATHPGPTEFLDSPPLTLDDQLEYKETKLADGVPLVSSFFDNMTSATTAWRCVSTSCRKTDLPLISLLPALLTQTGVIDERQAHSL